MSEVAERLKVELSGLTLLEQLEIADSIYDRVPSPPGLRFVEGSAEFDAMLARRLDDLRSGRDPGVPAEEFMEELRLKYAK